MGTPRIPVNFFGMPFGVAGLLGSVLLGRLLLRPMLPLASAARWRSR